MQYLGLAPTHGTQHCMGINQKNFSWDFWCVDFWVVTMGPHIERIVDVSISPPSDDLAILSKEEVKCLQHNVQATNVLFSALSEDIFYAIIFGDGEPLDDAHLICTTLKEKYDKSKCDEKLLSLVETLEECSTSPTNE